MSINSTHIHWFTTDLRLDDLPVWQELHEVEHFFGVYVLDPRAFQYLPYGFRKMGLARLQFLREHLVELQSELRTRGSDLLVCYGYPEQLLPQLMDDNNAQLSFSRGYATEERLIQEELFKIVPAQRLSVYESDFLWTNSDSFKNGFPKSFTGFRKKAEKALRDRKWTYLTAPNTLPSSPLTFPAIKSTQRNINPSSAVPLLGGCKSAKAHLNNYLFQKKNAQNYKQTRNQLIGLDYSSKWSIYLALGAVSPKIIMTHLKRFEQEIVANESTYWLFFELLWRDFFRHAGKFYKDQLFHFSGILNHRPDQSGSEHQFKKWMLGQTPSDFINAALMELSTTGYMSNRARQNAASFLVHDLKVDWRKGAAWFEHHLLDYDVYSNQGNWMYIAGVGFDPQGGRRFDIDFQAQRYDQDRLFRDLWT